MGYITLDVDEVWVWNEYKFINNEFIKSIRVTLLVDVDKLKYKNCKGPIGYGISNQTI